jgi:hypothetical protein
MTATAVTAQTPVFAGTTRSAGTAGNTSDGNSVVNTGKTLVLVKNTAGTSATVTLPITRTVLGQAVTSKTYTIAAGAEVLIPLPGTDDVGATVVLTPSATTVEFNAITL